MSRHVAPATIVRLAREDYARKHPEAGLLFDQHRRSLGRGKRAAR